jgi:hypothetical protein
MLGGASHPCLLVLFAEFGQNASTLGCGWWAALEAQITGCAWGLEDIANLAE